MNRDIPEIRINPPEYPEEESARYPRCACCEKEIRSKYYYDIGDILCTACMNENYRYETERYSY